MMNVAIPFPEIHRAAFTIPALNLGDLTLGPFPLRWYALGYIFGLLAGWWYANRIVSRPKLWGDRDIAPVNKADLDDFIFWVMIGILVGGRLGYVLFYMLPYKPEDVFSDPLVIFRMWDGGMSFHGGLIGSLAATIYTAMSRKIPFLSLADVACAAAPIGIFLVRVTNFINGELYGRPTDAPWGVIFPAWDASRDGWVYSVTNAAGVSQPVGSVVPVHPSQLYEAALEGLLLFAILAAAIWGFRALRRPGLVSGLFLVGYASFRSFVENFRQPDDFVHGLPSWLTMGMLLSAPMFIAGVWLLVRARTQRSLPA